MESAMAAVAPLAVLVAAGARRRRSARGRARRRLGPGTAALHAGGSRRPTRGGAGTAWSRSLDAPGTLAASG